MAVVVPGVKVGSDSWEVGGAPWAVLGGWGPVDGPPAVRHVSRVGAGPKGVGGGGGGVGVGPTVAGGPRGGEVSGPKEASSVGWVLGCTVAVRCWVEPGKSGGVGNRVFRGGTRGWGLTWSGDIL